MKYTVRRGFRHYLPFSEPRYKGRYPLGAPRGDNSSTNTYKKLYGTSTDTVLRRAAPLSLYEDRRRWHPLGASAWPRSLTSSNPRVMEYSPFTDPEWKRFYPYSKPGVPKKILIPNPRGHDYFAASDKPYPKVARYNFGWEDPWKMIICLKRKIRREVMMAMGYKGGSFKPPKYSQFSFVRCS